MEIQIIVDGGQIGLGCDGGGYLPGDAEGSWTADEWERVAASLSARGDGPRLAAAIRREIVGGGE